MIMAAPAPAIQGVLQGWAGRKLDDLIDYLDEIEDEYDDVQMINEAERETTAVKACEDYGYTPGDTVIFVVYWNEAPDFDPHKRTVASDPIMLFC